MTDKPGSVSLGAIGHMVRSVTEKPLKRLTDRVSERKRAKNGLQRLLDAIDRTPVEAPKRRAKA